MVEIIYASDAWHANYMPSIAAQICQDQNIDFMEYTDPSVAMALSKGAIDPRTGYIIRAKDNVYLDYFGLVDYIVQNGLKQC